MQLMVSYEALSGQELNQTKHGIVGGMRPGGQETTLANWQWWIPKSMQLANWHFNINFGIPKPQTFGNFKITENTKLYNTNFIRNEHFGVNSEVRSTPKCTHIILAWWTWNQIHTHAKARWAQLGYQSIASSPDFPLAAKMNGWVRIHFCSERKV